MKALFIGGTGTISTACSALAIENGFELTVLNRGNRDEFLHEGIKAITADINDEEKINALLDGQNFDVVADFIAFSPEHIKRDIRLFKDKVNQYIFISSASAYQKPVSNYLITESTPLANPFWQYSRNKIACEELLMAEYRENGFPVTIVRPSHTYGLTSVPVALHGANGSWQVIRRILDGKPVIVHGDGLSWWTFTHNTDFAKGFVGLMANIHAIGEAVHITSDEKITWNTAYELIGRALGKKTKLVHVASERLIKYNADWEGALLGDKANSVIFDNGKIKRLVPEFVATTRFDAGVRKCIEYICAHPKHQALDPDFDTLCDKIISDALKIC